MYEMVPRKTLVKYGSKGLGGIAGGAVVLLLGGLGSVASLVVGGIIGAVGLVLSGSKGDRTAGLIALGAGAATMLTAVPVVHGIAGTILTVSGITLLVTGAINLFRFIRGYKSRS